MPVTNPSNFARARAALRFTTHPITGNVYFVSSVSGSATGGYTADAPAATLAQALALCTDDNGDVIFVMPGHVETVHTAAYLTLSQKGVTVIGLGNGDDRGTFTWDATASQIIVSGKNTTFRNLRFDLTGIDAVVAGFSVTAADVAFEDCEFITNGATTGCVRCILTAATATRFRVSRCRFLGAKTNTGTTTTAQISHEVGENFVIEDSHFEGKCTQNILNAATIINGLIRNCTFHTYTGTKSISVAAATQAWIVNCRFCVASGTAPIVGTIVNVLGNLYTTEGIGVVAGTAATI